jgi:hypothetical protein
MSSNASEARRLRPDQRKRSKDHDISNHKYTCWDKQALHVDTNVAIVYSVGTLTLRLRFRISIEASRGTEGIFSVHLVLKLSVEVCFLSSRN